MDITLRKIAEKTGGKAEGELDKKISGVAPFDLAGEHDITLAGSKSYLKIINECKAGAFIVPANADCKAVNLIRTDNPRAVFARALNLFCATEIEKASFNGISPQASIGRNFKCGREVAIAPNVTIGNNVVLGNRVVLYPGVVIGNDVSVGDDVVLHSNVSVLWGCVIGNRVMIHAGSVIGSDGFGLAPDADAYIKIPHTGIVRIEDDVEIGAGNTIDRATFGETGIKKGVKTDNLVHIAHNVDVGENTIIVAQVGVAGSSTIGKHVTIAGQSGISGHIKVGDNATIGPQSGILKSVSENDVVSGMPGISHKLWLKSQNIVAKLPEIKKRIIKLEKQLDNMKKKELE